MKRVESLDVLHGQVRGEVDHGSRNIHEDKITDGSIREGVEFSSFTHADSTKCTRSLHPGKCRGDKAVSRLSMSRDEAQHIRGILFVTHTLEYDTRV